MTGRGDECFEALIDNLLAIDVSQFQGLHAKICQAIFQSLPKLKFVSILRYNWVLDEAIYGAIDLDYSAYRKEAVVDLIRKNIRMNVSDSVSGRLIKSNDNILVVEDVLRETDYKSIELAKSLGLKKAVFLKIRELKTKDVCAVVVYYPADDSPAAEPTKRELSVLVSVIENVLSNAKRMKEYGILIKILDSARKVKKDLSSFLHRCVEIISKEVPVRGCSVFVVDPFDHLIKLKATLGIKPGPRYEKQYKEFVRRDVYYSIGEEVTGQIVKNNVTQVLTNENVFDFKWVEKEMSTTFLGVPIPAVDDENEAIGVIRCSAKSNTLLDTQFEAFDQEDIEFISYIAKLISTFIELSFYQENQKLLIMKMPHEIKASLNSIGSTCDLLDLLYEKGKLLGSFAKFANSFRTKIDDIRSECNLSQMTVNSVSAFEDEIDVYDFELTDLFSEIIAKVRKMLNPIALKDRNIQIVYNNEYRLPQLYVDKKRMQLVFHNLLMNAIKYSHKRTSYQSLNDILIRSAVAEDGTSYVIHLSSSGIPVPVSLQKDIFLYGVRAIEAQAIDPNGKGFGLALVKAILDMHKSRIAVTRLYDPTTFTLFFPTQLAKTKPKDLASESDNDTDD